MSEYVGNPRVHFFFEKIQIQISESKSGIWVSYCEIHKIHTPGGIFRSNLSQDSLRFITRAFFGRRSEKSSFGYRLSMQKWYIENSTVRELPTESFVCAIIVIARKSKIGTI